MKQLEFDFFENIDCYNINNFIINSSNFNAYNYLTNLDNKDHFIFLSGEDKSGKTYLSLIWKQLVNARNIDFNTLNNLSFDDFINDALENGFYMLTDSDGIPEAIDSQELIAGRDQKKAEMLAAIREKLEKKSTANKTNRTLYGRS